MIVMCLYVYAHVSEYSVFYLQVFGSAALHVKLVSFTCV